MPHYIDKPRGIRKHSPLLAAPVAGAAAALYQVTVGRTVILRKVMCFSNVGNCDVNIGVGLAGAFAAVWPTFYVLNLFDAQWMEDEIVEVELNQDITVESSIVGCLVQIEIEEIGT